MLIILLQGASALWQSCNGFTSGNGTWGGQGEGRKYNINIFKSGLYHGKA